MDEIDSQGEGCKPPRVPDVHQGTPDCTVMVNLTAQEMEVLDFWADFFRCSTSAIFAAAAWESLKRWEQQHTFGLPGNGPASAN